MSQPERDALRKEVFDYLRQLQKREEQTAKISGLSSWVLVGAMWYLAAWFLDHSDAYSQQALMTGISVGLGFLFVKMLISPSRRSFSATDARLMQFVSEDSSAIGLAFFGFSISLVLPALASFWLFGWTIPVVFAALIALVFAGAFLVGPLIKPFLTKPLFRTVDQASKTTSAFMLTLALVALLIHFKHLFDTTSSMAKAQLVFSAYVSAFWWATLELLRTEGSKASIKRYERLEEALMFNVATPHEILKRLELQAFGPSLEKELNVLEEAIQAANAVRNSAQVVFEKAFEETKTVPPVYRHEINNRLEIAYKPLNAATHKLIDAIGEKVDYINTLLVIRAIQLTPMAKQLIEKETLQLRSRLNGLKEESLATTHQLLAFSASVDEGLKSNRLSPNVTDIERSL